ncbi:NBS-LRR type resistance protein [Cucumis melo var. makuwa]|uniref:NBS-LRR type resistance protein n=1 Tax=Cucumis melo var. makuwa TaxID=1194695 RepID=A0A5A7TZM9_CUCMM|nr:NBS-LRR type resistance protein [Cucumis melo var. makuwa]
MAFTHPSCLSSGYPTLQSSGPVERTYQSRDPEGYTYQSSDPEGCIYQSSALEECTYQSSAPEGCTYQSSAPEGCTYPLCQSDSIVSNNYTLSCYTRFQFAHHYARNGATTSDGSPTFDDRDESQLGGVRRPAPLQRSGERLGVGRHGGMKDARRHPGA